jgi:hypothetical protein
MFPPFLGFFDAIGDRSQSDHGPKFAKVSARGRPVLLPWRENILRAGGIKSRGPFLSPSWTLVQRVFRAALLAPWQLSVRCKQINRTFKTEVALPGPLRQARSSRSHGTSNNVPARRFKSTHAAPVR